MKRTLVIAAVVLGFAASAGAATLSVASDKASYLVGETITLTVSGNHGTESTTSIYAAVSYDAALTHTVSASQTPLTTAFGMNTWVQGTHPQTDGASAVLNQILGVSDGQAGGPTSSATVTLVAEAAGVVNVAFLQSGGPGGGVLDYFSLVDAGSPNITNTSFTIVPEPTVATLIGLGLVGLAVGGRRRSS